MTIIKGFSFAVGVTADKTGEGYEILLVNDGGIWYTKKSNVRKLI